MQGFADPKIAQLQSARDIHRQLAKQLRQEWYAELEEKAKRTKKEVDIKAWKRAPHRAMTVEEKERIEAKANKIIATTPHLKDLLGEYSVFSDSDDEEPHAKRVSISRDLKLALATQTFGLPDRRLRSETVM